MAENQYILATELKRMQNLCLLQSLASMRNPAEADITIQCENKEFPVHKVILNANSAYFRAMFQCDMTEKSSGKVTFKAMDSKTLEITLDFMYLGDVTNVNCAECALKVLAASHLLQLEKLFQFCCKYLPTVLSCHNFHDIWIAAQKYNREDVCIEVINYMIADIDQVIHCSDFLSLSVEKIRQLMAVANDYPQVIEKILLGLIKWYSNDVTVREVFIHELLANINSNFLNKEFLKSLFENKLTSLPGSISVQMQILGWPVMSEDQHQTPKPLDKCLGVKLIYFSEFRVEGKYDPISKRVVKCKVSESCVQVLELHTMTWLQPQTLPSLELQGTAMCQYRDKIYIVGGKLKSLYIVYDVAANSVEYVRCSAFNDKMNGTLCVVGDLLYFVEPADNDENRFKVLIMKPGESRPLHCSSWFRWPSAMVVASPKFLFIFYNSSNESVKYSYRFSVLDGRMLHSDHAQMDNLPNGAETFFVNSDDCCYGFYESHGNFIQLSHNATTDTWTAKVCSKCPPKVNEVKAVYRSSQDIQGVVFVASGDNPYQIPDYVLEPKQCTWHKLPMPKGQCFIPDDEKIQKAYFVENCAFTL